MSEIESSVNLANVFVVLHFFSLSIAVLKLQFHSLVLLPH